MTVRENRLWAELNTMEKFRSEVITWRTLGNNTPPDVYRFTYHLKSIVGFDSSGRPQYHKGFAVEIRFPPEYPRRKPDVYLVEKPWPFHPNIWSSDGRFCLDGTQNWIPGIGVSLDSVCLMIGEIIAFQEVNLGSPANRDAVLTTWVEKNLRFEGPTTKVANPVDPAQIRLPDIEDTIRWGEAPHKDEPRIRFG